jgi:hypothetical protein
MNPKGGFMKTWEIEKMFKDDIREKKKTGTGAFHQRGKGVKHGLSGALRTPYHFMKTKEKKKLDGEVEVYNMYETILNWNDFNLKDKETQKNLLTRWRDIYPNNKIMAELEKGRSKTFNSQSFADLVNGLGCPPKDRSKVTKGPRKPRVAKKVVAIEEKAPTIEPSLPQTTLELAPEPERPSIPEHVKLLTKGLYLEFNGSYDAEAISKIFTKLQLLVDGEPNKFKINISITEEA